MSTGGRGARARREAARQVGVLTSDQLSVLKKRAERAVFLAPRLAGLFEAAVGAGLISACETPSHPHWIDRLADVIRSLKREE